jgi:hypothetical protein
MSAIVERTVVPTRTYLFAQRPGAVVVPKGLAQRLLSQRDDGSLGYMGAVVVLLGLGRPAAAASVHREV